MIVIVYVYVFTVFLERQNILIQKKSFRHAKILYTCASMLILCMCTKFHIFVYTHHVRKLNRFEKYHNLYILVSIQYIVHV